MSRIFGLSAALLIAAHHTANAATGTISSPDPAWFSAGLAMTAVAIGLYVRAKRNERKQQDASHPGMPAHA